MRQTRSVRKGDRAGNRTGNKTKMHEGRKERVLVEFPVQLLRRTDEAARSLEQNRSELIRNAMERLLDEIESTRLERELAAAYTANAQMNRVLAEEFAEIDREGF